MPDRQAATLCTKTREYLDPQVVERDFRVELLGERSYQPGPGAVGRPSRPLRDDKHDDDEHQKGEQDGRPNDDGSDPGHERAWRYKQDLGQRMDLAL